MYNNEFTPYCQPYEVRPIIPPSFQMRKLRHGET